MTDPIELFGQFADQADTPMQRLNAAAAWLTAHGVDPNRYPIGGKLYPTAGGGWNAYIVAHNEHGRPYLDKHTRAPATEVIHIADDGNPPPPWLLLGAGLP